MKTSLFILLGVIALLGGFLFLKFVYLEQEKILSERIDYVSATHEVRLINAIKAHQPSVNYYYIVESDLPSKGVVAKLLLKNVFQEGSDEPEVVEKTATGISYRWRSSRIEFTPPAMKTRIADADRDLFQVLSPQR